MASGSQEEASHQAWVTLATNDSYALGALVLAHSLKRSGTLRKLVIMVTHEGLSSAMKSQLAAVFDEVVDVSLLDSDDQVNLALLERPELGITFTKLHCWCLVQYTKCVFLDADTMVLKNSDELFNREELSAAPDAGWPDCFNSGVFVFSPSRDTYKALLQHAADQGSFDGGDQGLLNTFFHTWATQDIGKHLPFLYNMCATATYTYLPAYKRYGKDVKIIHFIGASKPWHVKFDAAGHPQAREYEEHTVGFLKQWWHIFHSDAKPLMSKIGTGDHQQHFEELNPVLTTAGFTEAPKHSEHCQAPCFEAAKHYEAPYETPRSYYEAPKHYEAVVHNSPSSEVDDAKDTTTTSGGEASIEEVSQCFGADAAAVVAAGTFVAAAAATEEPSKDSGDQFFPQDRHEWEKGQPDFRGRHSFDNILKKIDSTMSSPKSDK